MLCSGYEAWYVTIACFNQGNETLIAARLRNVMLSLQQQMQLHGMYPPLAAQGGTTTQGGQFLVHTPACVRIQHTVRCHHTLPTAD